MPDSAPRQSDTAEHSPGAMPAAPDRLEALDAMQVPHRRRQRSLFGEILDWMLVPLLLVWPLSIGITYFVATTIANQHFDEGLARRITVLTGMVQHNPADMLPLLRQPGVDSLTGGGSIVMQLRAPSGRVLGGAPSLPLPPDAASPHNDGMHMRETVIHGKSLRIAWRWIPDAMSGAVNDSGQSATRAQRPAHAPSPDSRRARFDQLGSARRSSFLLLQVAEGLESRTQLSRNIVRGVILPQFIIVPISILLVWFGLGQGIVPLNDLQARIRRRRPDDLSPIDQQEAPEEIAPLVDSINGLLGRLAQSIHAQKRFIADAAHQLKTPLAGLRMQAELAARQTDPQELRTSLRQIGLSVVRTTRLVNQLLALARAENQGLATHGAYATLDLREPVRDAVQELAPLALDKGLELEFDAPDLPLWVRGHALLLHELTKNLLDNAIAYTPTSGSVAVRLRADATNRQYVLSVEDTGVGIPPAERNLVFRPFYRVLGTGHDGSGLGLCIVQEIARQHAASVELDDNAARENQGAAGLIVRVRFADADTTP